MTSSSTPETAVADLPRMSDCRDCADPIRFVTNQATGRRIPVNPAPTRDGSGGIAARLIRTPKGRDLVGYPITRDRGPDLHHPMRFTVHAATCKSRPRPAIKPDPTPVEVDAPLF